MANLDFFKSKSGKSITGASLALLLLFCSLSQSLPYQLSSNFSSTSAYETNKISDTQAVYVVFSNAIGTFISSSITPVVLSSIFYQSTRMAYTASSRLPEVLLSKTIDSSKLIEHSQNERVIIFPFHYFL